MPPPFPALLNGLGQLEFAVNDFEKASKCSPSGRYSSRRSRPRPGPSQAYRAAPNGWPRAMMKPFRIC